MMVTDIVYEILNFRSELMQLVAVKDLIPFGLRESLMS
jgi:hypothetical protein